MNWKRVTYWICSGLVAAAMAASCLAYLVGAMDEAMNHLGYPRHFTVVLGVWKGLSAIALLVPIWPRVREWAYAGLTFVLSGAVLAHTAAGDGPQAWVSPIVMLLLLGGSYYTRPDVTTPLTGQD